MLEEILTQALSPLFDGRVYPDVAPIDAESPYCTYQQVGGMGINYLEGSGSDKKHSRIQINVWGDRRDDVMRLIRKIEDIVVASPLFGYVEGAAQSRYDDGLRGAMQDFSFWAKP